MDLSTRKLNVITYLSQLQDEVFFEKLEKVILKKQKSHINDCSPFSVEQLVNRIEQSELDYSNGKFKTQEDLEKISSQW